MEQARRGRSYHHGDLRSALINAASEMLERDGPEAISLRAVARATGVSQTAPYNHFQSKEDLLGTVAAAGFRDLEASQMAAAKAARTGEKRITALGLDYVSFASGHPQLYRLMFGAGVSDWHAHSDIAAAKGAAFGPIKDVLAEHMGAGGGANPEAVKTAAIGAWALVHGLSMLLVDHSLDPAKKADGNAETLVAGVLKLFVAGLKPGAGMPGAE